MAAMSHARTPMNAIGGDASVSATSVKPEPLRSARHSRETGGKQYRFQL